MKKRIASSLIMVRSLLLAEGLGYWRGLSCAQHGARVIVASDTSDKQPSSSGKTGYEPYFTRQNPIPDKLK